MKLVKITKETYPEIKDKAKIYRRVTILLLMTIVNAKLRASLENKINLADLKLV